MRRRAGPRSTVKQGSATPAPPASTRSRPAGDPARSASRSAPRRTGARRRGAGPAASASSRTASTASANDAGLVGDQQVLARHEVEALCADRGGDGRHAEAQALEDLEAGAAAAAERDDQRPRGGHVVPDVLDLAGHPHAAAARRRPGCRPAGTPPTMSTSTSGTFSRTSGKISSMKYRTPSRLASTCVVPMKARRGPASRGSGRRGERLDRVDRVDHGLDVRHAPRAEDLGLPVRRGEQQIEPTADRQLLPSHLPRLEAERRPPERLAGPWPLAARPARARCCAGRARGAARRAAGTGPSASGRPSRRRSRSAATIASSVRCSSALR